MVGGMAASSGTWKLALTARVAEAAHRLLTSTYRLTLLDEPLAHRRRREGSDERGIYTMYHRDLWNIICMIRDQGVTSMVSEHRDGEIIARVLESYGFRNARGSSTRGGARALMDFLRVGKQGDMAITVDGPRGPPEVVKEGVVFAASRTGCPIYPVGIASSRAWRAKSWDRLVVGKPFARVTIGLGPAIHVPRKLAREEIGSWCRRVEQALVSVAQDVAARAGHADVTATEDC